MESHSREELSNGEVRNLDAIHFDSFVANKQTAFDKMGGRVHGEIQFESNVTRRQKMKRLATNRDEFEFYARTALAVPRKLASLMVHWKRLVVSIAMLRAKFIRTYVRYIRIYREREEAR